MHYQHRRSAGRSTWTVNHNSPKIVHVGMGCTRSQKVINASKESGRIVVGKKSGGNEAQLAGAPEGCVVNSAPGRTVGTRSAATSGIGGGGQTWKAGPPARRQGKRQRIFLVRPAASLAAHRHGELAPRKNDGATALRLQVERNACVL